MRPTAQLLAVILSLFFTTGVGPGEVAAQEPQAATRDQVQSRQQQPGKRPEDKNPKQALFIRFQFPIWNFAGQPLPKKWGKLRDFYAMVFCWPQTEREFKVGEARVLPILLTIPAGQASHVDGVPLLDRQGRPVGCGDGWLVLPPGKHTLRIRDQDYSVHLARGKYTLVHELDTEEIGNRECIAGTCWQPTRVLGATISLYGVKWVLDSSSRSDAGVKIELSDLQEIWDGAHFSPGIEETLQDRGLDPDELLRRVILQLGAPSNN